jgi:hypothetical protein
MTRINPNNILVTYSRGRFQGRIQTSLSFEEKYADALRHALDAVRAGCADVKVIQYREIVHNGTQLKEAARYLHRNSSDEEIIEECHHASRTYVSDYLMSWAAQPSSVLWCGL